MHTFEWNQHCSVGIPEIDAQHRQLIELLGELSACVRKGDSRSLAPTALVKVISYAERHLQREELILRVRAYPGYATHKAEHDAYREKAAALQHYRDRRDVGIRVANFLTEWWRSHILVSDQQYARIFQDSRTSSTRGGESDLPTST
ncbi:MAG: bacteriohemerythrin [Candidatus Solibacter sp.]